MKKKLFAILSLTGLFLFISTADISAQYNFDDVVDQAVFSWGEDGEWDDGQVWYPAVIKDGDTLRMWYTGADEIVWYGPPSKIGYAWSLDGVEWNRYSENPILEAELEWEGNYLFGCAVIKDGDTFKMWYGANGVPSSIIGYATSTDGKAWVKHPMPVLELGPTLDWDESNITPKTVIKENGEYKLWYWGAMPGFPWKRSMPQSGLATSTDGINWTKYDDQITTDPPYAFSDPVLKLGETGDWDVHRTIDPMVIKKGSGYEMCYVGASWDEPYHDIGYAQSNDGIHWVKYPEPVLTRPNWGNTTYGGTLLKFEDVYHLWYACFHSNDGMADPQIGYATAITPVQMIDNIIAKVEELEDAGVLNKGQANALIKKLEAAQESINKGNYNAAINQLNAFINQVSAFMNAGILTVEQGNELMTDAQAVIDILENFPPGFKTGESGLVDNDEIIGIFNLEQNFPNPFNGNTTISFTLAEPNITTLKVYNSMGQEVETLFSGEALANERYHIEFNGSNLAGGIYFYHLQSGKEVNATNKMLLIK